VPEKLNVLKKSIFSYQLSFTTALRRMSMQLVLLLAVLTSSCAAQFFDTKLLMSQQCSSHNNMYVTQVQIASEPASAVDLLVLAKPAEMIDIRCFQVFKNGPEISAALQHLCSNPTTYLLCTSPILADPYDRNWTCNPLPSAYDSVPRSSYS
jgi:hypothetical protein